MLPFDVEITSGESAYRQIVYAATKAIVSGELLPGVPFPSVRVISQALKVNPNTAQKAVGELIREGLLEVQPGVGTLVAQWGPASPKERSALLHGDLERLIVESRRLGLSIQELEAALRERWDELFGSEGRPGPALEADDEVTA